MILLSHDSNGLTQQQVLPAFRLKYTLTTSLGNRWIFNYRKDEVGQMASAATFNET